MSTPSRPRWTKSRAIRIAPTGRWSTRPRALPSISSARRQSPRSWSSTSAAGPRRAALPAASRICERYRGSFRGGSAACCSPDGTDSAAGSRPGWLKAAGPAGTRAPRCWRGWDATGLFSGRCCRTWKWCWRKSDLAIGGRYAQLAQSRQPWHDDRCGHPARVEPHAAAPARSHRSEASARKQPRIAAGAETPPALHRSAESPAGRTDQAPSRRDHRRARQARHPSDDQRNFGRTAQHRLARAGRVPARTN